MTYSTHLHHLKTVGAVAALAACLTAPLTATAAGANTAMDNGKPMAGTPAHDSLSTSDREYMKGWTDEKGALEARLKMGDSRASYQKMLAEGGYTVTAVNADKPDYLEYEVVKGNHSYEVQIDVDKATGRAKKVDVTSNLWRADATKAALKGNKVPVATSYVPGGERYSERAHMKGWTGEKDALEKALAPGADKSSYAAQLKKLGYQITSINDNDRDHVEYEVVKGDHSYEVQIDFVNMVGKKVDVTTNMWESDATERALSQHKGS